MKTRDLIATAGLLAIAAACAPSATTTAGEPLDRSVMPQPAATPAVEFPEIQRFTLSNGLPVWFVETPGMPLLTVQLLVDAGAVAEGARNAGVASLTASMLTRGTARRSATEIAEEIEFLAANLSANAGRESAVVNLSTLSRNLDPAFEIFADVVMNAAFSESEWERVRAERLAAIAQSRDQAAVLASEEFSRRVYGRDHAFGRPVQGTRATVESLTAADLRGFHAAHYRPTNSDLIVVGDVDRSRLRELLERHLGGWSGESAERTAAVPAPTPPAATRIFLIDRPGAAQSEIRIGHPGIRRSDPDYIPVLLMNAILGGQFSSRINLNLREDKGYTYGASSAFQTGRDVGAFVTGGGVQTAVTAESLVEFMREIEDIRGPRPVSPEELEFARAGILRSEPLAMQTNAQIASRIQQLALYDLPLDYFDEFNERVAATTLDDVNRVARQYIRPDRAVIVVVGDRSVIEPSLRELPYPIEIVEVED